MLRPPLLRRMGQEYEGKEVDFDPSMYVAGGIACWDLQVRP